MQEAPRFRTHKKQYADERITIGESAIYFEKQKPMQTIRIKPLSVNEARQGRRYKTKKYLAYEKMMLMMLRAEAIPQGKIRLQVEVWYSNTASDIDNCLKPLLDILQKRYAFNDNMIYQLYIEKKIVKKGEEYISFWIVKI